MALPIAKFIAEKRDIAFRSEFSTTLASVGGLIVATIVAALVGISTFGIWSIDEKIRAYEGAASDALLSSEINADKAKVLLNAREYLVTRSDQDLADTRRYLAETKAGIAATLADTHDDKDAAALRNIAGALVTFESGLDRLVELLNRRDQIVADELDVIGPRIRQGIADFIAISMKIHDYKNASLAGLIQEDLLTARSTTSQSARRHSSS